MNPSSSWANGREEKEGWLGRCCLMILLGSFALLRLPALCHQAGGQDEQFFSIPGWTVYREGIPRIPYLPSRNRATFFENADRCLMALPPGLFYVQAPFFAVLPPGYPTSRLPSFLGALAMIVLTFAFARQLGAGTACAVIAAAALTLSRPLMFTGILARPDLLCCLCGLGAVMILFRFEKWTAVRTPVAVGSLCGLAALFHPFALVFAILAAITCALSPGTILARLQRLVLVGVSSVMVLALWLPLIVKFPQEFFSQFTANVLERSGPGLFSRLLWPVDSIKHQFGNLYEFAGPWQMGLLAVLVMFISVVGFFATPRRRWDWIGLTWASIYFTATVAGMHPTLGYWLFPTSVILACSSAALSQLRPSRIATVVLSIIVLVLLLPGAGLRMSWLYLRHFGETEYHAQKFIAKVLNDLPREGVYVVDLSYVFDVYLTGRETLLSGNSKDCWGELPERYECLLLCWEGMDAKVPEQFGATKFRLVGDPQQLGTNYVYLYTSDQYKGDQR